MIKNFITGASLLLAVTAIGLHFFTPASSKMVYVDTGLLYSEFHLAKELNKELEGVLKIKKAAVDSTYESLKRLTQEIRQKQKPGTEEIQTLKRLEEVYVYKQRQYEKESQELSTNNNNKIWNQINQYVLEYGQNNNYTFILGATGEGTIMYGDKNMDVTNKVIEFINKQYEGNK
jgi:outer membrane protein